MKNSKKKFVSEPGETTVRKATKQELEQVKARTRQGKLGGVLGYSVVSVIRAMGKEGWDVDTAKAALAKAGIEAADHTVKIGLKRGRKGEKFIAPLSAQQLDSLRAEPVKPKKAAKAKKVSKAKETDTAEPSNA